MVFKDAQQILSRENQFEKPKSPQVSEFNCDMEKPEFSLFEPC